jgi:hypothetical protein
LKNRGIPVSTISARSFMFSVLRLKGARTLKQTP